MPNAQRTVRGDEGAAVRQSAGVSVDESGILVRDARGPATGCPSGDPDAYSIERWSVNLTGECSGSGPGFSQVRVSPVVGSLEVGSGE